MVRICWLLMHIRARWWNHGYTKFVWGECDSRDIITYVSHMYSKQRPGVQQYH